MGPDSGKRAYDTIYIDDTLVGPAATRGTRRRGSGASARALAGRPRASTVDLLRERGGRSRGTFDGKGGLSVAIFDNECTRLPGLGRFAWENTLVQPNTGRHRDHGHGGRAGALIRRTSNSQLYMYVGKKDRRRGATVLQRNGLDGGDALRVRSKDQPENSERAFPAAPCRRVGANPGRRRADRGGARGRQRRGRSDDLRAAGRRRLQLRGQHEFFFVTTGDAAGANVTRTSLFAPAQPGRPDRPDAEGRLQRRSDHCGRRRHRDQPGQHRRERHSTS